MNPTPTIISFFGNPGSGKSTLCNSLIGYIAFNSGVSIGQGMTTKSQTFQLGSKIIVDSPGLADPVMRERVAVEIETSLKQNGDYKIIFVVTLDSGRVKVQDLETLNTIIRSIKTPFEYGLIINKVTPRVAEKLKLCPADLQACIKMVEKMPFETLVIKKINDLEDQDNVLIEDSSIKQELLAFFDKIPSRLIRKEQVGKVEVRDYDKKVKEMETKLTELTQQIQRSQQENERLMKNTENMQNQLSREIEVNRENTKQHELHMNNMKLHNDQMMNVLNNNLQEQRALTQQAIARAEEADRKAEEARNRGGGGGGGCTIM
ncbi:hypothetical protein PPL_05600 [Heterostelium album PN500]|uniref:G domain-containing protein n=1 Tax=Heterostelium pallidum (strain ATCC 26659 / Pp 5 / PN500) TaxID=670386 RepID=D3BAM2_HETP5|nr:hypothetical protein PPL_05600 [Heterostelium album PN500]EFA81609.1 hypothetical protein PPL_05600 [Heterostelium album PN500]|eukprot:XP_020433726.1 hypothetical protein PPL_05600 [Heterostelium album PN500]